MRAAFILTFVVNLILVGVSYAISPEQVAIHFGIGGHPDNWGSSLGNALFMTGVHILIFVPLFFSAKLTRICPRQCINLPNKAYWMKDENWGRAEAILTREIDLFGTVIFSFMFIVGLLALQANLSTPVLFREDLFWWPFGLFMAFTVYWTVRLMRRFRVPGREIHK